MPKAIVFFDGQNLFRSAQEAFRVPYPDFDPQKLARRICADLGWDCHEVRFYTGVPDENESPGWAAFWKQKRLQMSRDNVEVITRQIRYRKETIELSPGNSITKTVGREKGIDVRISLDVVSCVYKNRCDAILIFSQDQDLAEAVLEAQSIAKEKGIGLKVASAFPSSETAKNKNGLHRTKNYPIKWDLYKECKDPKQYPKP